jgi:hypothetical protein
MAKHAKTLAVIEAARVVLESHNPMTLRQVYYRLVSRQVLENTRAQYQALSNALVTARQEGVIPWDWIEDRTRRPRSVNMWRDLADFAQTAVRAYRRDVWGSQPCYLETWLEKDALSGIFESVLSPYGVTLCVGRGYDGWSSIHGAAERYGDGGGVTVLYFGDFDPSGEDMVRSLSKRLGFFECQPEIVKCALTAQDIENYHLPPDFTKRTDTRAAAFVAKWGDMAVELDALPPDVLEKRLRSEVESRLDLAALGEVKRQERADRARLAVLLEDGND